MRFDPGAIKHLGLQMYSTLPPVLAELVANAWDAGAGTVRVTIPTGPLDSESEIIVGDDGQGMTEDDIRNRYLVVGRDRRAAEGTDERTEPPHRKIMGRKGIGKFAGFGIAHQVEVESVKDGQASRMLMDYGEIENAARRNDREVTFPSLPPTGAVTAGTRVILRNITKYRTRSINIDKLRRGLARRFSVLGAGFDVTVNDEPITTEERDVQRLLEIDSDDQRYMWMYEDVEIAEGSGWRVSGWIGTLNRTDKSHDGLVRGIVVMARGKLVQEPFVFDATVGQQYALSYIVGELHAEFVDAIDDTVGTARSTLVWDTPANAAFHQWGEAQVQKIAREWAERRSKDKESRLKDNPAYQRFVRETEQADNKRAKRVADKLIRSIIARNPAEDDDETNDVVQLCIDFVEFDAFWDLAEELTNAGTTEPLRLVTLFREWELVEAKEMARVTRGRIATIEKLADLIERNALEVPVLHNFLKEFPWVIDPRWQLVDDEVYFSALLREHFPESDDVPEEDRRIDFLCVNEGETLVVVEIKRPRSRVSEADLGQIETYVNFVRDQVMKSSDEGMRDRAVTGYLLCGTVVDTFNSRGRVRNLANAGIYVRHYGQLLDMVRKNHSEFLDRYQALKATRLASAD
jgi:hypothetical protein